MLMRSAQHWGKRGEGSRSDQFSAELTLARSDSLRVEGGEERNEDFRLPLFAH